MTVLSLNSKIKRKVIMVQRPNKTNTSNEVVKSVAWLIEATFRGFIGCWLIGHTHDWLIVLLAMYALATAALIVIVHFLKAHKG